MRSMRYSQHQHHQQPRSGSPSTSTQDASTVYFDTRGPPPPPSDANQSFDEHAHGHDHGLANEFRSQHQQQPPPPPPSPQDEYEPSMRSARPRVPSPAPAPAPTSAAFRGSDFFQCPELDPRMKKYLVRLANETANHLIKDTLELGNDASTPTATSSSSYAASSSGAGDGAIPMPHPHAPHPPPLSSSEHGSAPPDLQASDLLGRAQPPIVWKPLSNMKGISVLRGYPRDGSSSAANARTCLRGLSEVNASLEEFALLFKLDSTRSLGVELEHGLLFNQDLEDSATLYALVPPSGDHPRRYVGIKWCLVRSPSRLFRNRDFCYLECQKEFRDSHGRRGWVRSMHSIKLPCCPSLEKSHGIVRASLYRCGLVAVETEKPGVLDATYTVEMDVKGHFPEMLQASFLAQRVAALASIDKCLQQQRLSSSPLLGDLDIPAHRAKGTCHFCFRAFATFTRRFICRKCGEGVCRHCSDEWKLDIPVIGRRKVRICTVCSAEARFCHVNSTSGGGSVRSETMSATPAMDETDSVDGYRSGRRPRLRSNSLPSEYDLSEAMAVQQEQQRRVQAHYRQQQHQQQPQQRQRQPQPQPQLRQSVRMGAVPGSMARRGSAMSTGHRSGGVDGGITGSGYRSSDFAEFDDDLDGHHQNQNQSQGHGHGHGRGHGHGMGPRYSPHQHQQHQHQHQPPPQSSHRSHDRAPMAMASMPSRKPSEAGAYLGFGGGYDGYDVRDGYGPSHGYGGMRSTTDLTGLWTAHDAAMAMEKEAAGSGSPPPPPPVPTSTGVNTNMHRRGGTHERPKSASSASRFGHGNEAPPYRQSMQQAPYNHHQQQPPPQSNPHGGYARPQAMRDGQTQPENEPDQEPAEELEFIESENGEWVESRRGSMTVPVATPLATNQEHGVALHQDPLEAPNSHHDSNSQRLSSSLDAFDFDSLTAAATPTLITRLCESCGAKQFVRNGIVTSSCHCGSVRGSTADLMALPPVSPSSRGNRASERSSLASMGLSFNGSDNDSRRSSMVQLQGSVVATDGMGGIQVTVDVDQVLPLLVERLSMHQQALQQQQQ